MSDPTASVSASDLRIEERELRAGGAELASGEKRRCRGCQGYSASHQSSESQNQEPTPF